MIWQIEWAGEIIFGYEFIWIVADAIEIFTETIHVEHDNSGQWAEWMPAEYGHSCDGCGRYTITHTEQCNDGAETDRGLEWRLIDYELCDECRHEVRS